MTCRSHHQSRTPCFARRTICVTLSVGSSGGGASGGVSKSDMERLIAAAAQTAPAQTIRIEQAPVKITPETK